jgi:hypothetical protein
VFGHHPVTDTGASADTWLFYGQQDFIHALDSYWASTYNYGHTHDYSQALFSGNAYTGPMYNGGLHYYNVRSLGKDSGSYYSIVAIDCNGVSSVTPASNTWPVALITAPVDKYIGGAANPYAYTVPASSTNVVRALVFDSVTCTQVSYRVDGGATWYLMNRVAAGSPVWQGTWDASGLMAGDHTVQVRAVSAATVYDSATVRVTAATNRPPVAVNDSYDVETGKVLSVTNPGVLANDSDPDGDQMSTAMASPPNHGTVSLSSQGGFTYTPAMGFTGTDSFTYTASDGKALSNAGTVTITVNASPTTDTVDIVTATWTKKTKVLLVQATSSAQPNATLTVRDYGVMTWSGTLYTFSRKTPVALATVTVTSNEGGSDSSGVTVK